jgi:hypothetical protein
MSHLNPCRTQQDTGESVTGIKNYPKRIHAFGTAISCKCYAHLRHASVPSLDHCVHWQCMGRYHGLMANIGEPSIVEQPSQMEPSTFSQISQYSRSFDNII